MSKWIDYSGMRPDLLAVKAAGAVGVLRYLSEPVPATDWKRIGSVEKDHILASGLDLILNWEWYEGRMLEGAIAGVQDGAEALRQARALGYPKGATIFFSHDTSARDDAAVLAYLRAAQKALGSEYHADIYSGYDTVEMCMRTGAARYGWQTLAWSNGRIGKAHLYQNGRQWFSGGADENVVMVQPIGSWLQTEGSNPTPKPKPPTPHPKPIAARRYLVGGGDTLTSIAQRHHTTVNELLRLNPTLRSHPNLIRVGELLYVPGSPSPTPPPKVTRYRVVPGDTLSAIAKRYNTTVPRLLLLNRAVINNPNVIRVGWILRVH